MPNLQATLHHIALASPDPRALAAFHARALGLSVTECEQGLLGMGPQRRTYFVSGPAKALAFAAYAVADERELEALSGRLTAAGVAFDSAEETGLLVEGAIGARDPDGNRILFGIPLPDSALASDALPARLQHVVVASRDAARLACFYQDVFGFGLSDEVRGTDGALMTAFLRCSEEHHSFAAFQASSDRFDHHCYEAGEWNLIRDWGDHFAREHIKVEWGPGRHGPGNNLFMFIHDCDGNWLEISAELEVVAPDRPVGQWAHEQRTLNYWGSAPLRT